MTWCFRPKLLPTLAFLVLLPGFIQLGFWQYGKAEKKLALQASLDQRSRGPLVAMPTTPVAAEAMAYRRVSLRGHFDSTRQILVDNRVYQERAGFHVVTPLQLAGSDMRVLVNRGWIPAADNHAQLPQPATPEGSVEVHGLVVMPPSKFFTLGAEPAAGSWQRVWQNLDLARYRQAVDFPLQPVLVLLDADSDAGFVRDWPRPDERVEKNLGYAWQWWGFAAALVAIYIFVNLQRR